MCACACIGRPPRRTFMRACPARGSAKLPDGQPLPCPLCRFGKICMGEGRGGASQLGCPAAAETELPALWPARALLGELSSMPFPSGKKSLLTHAGYYIIARQMGGIVQESYCCSFSNSGRGSIPDASPCESLPLPLCSLASSFSCGSWSDSNLRSSLLTICFTT